MCLTSVASVRAEQAPADAIELGHGALDHFDSGQYDSALVLFQRADAIAHSPVFDLYIARCQRELGSLLAARDSYRAVEDEPLAADAPEAWLNARTAARAELSALAARIPSVVVEADFALTAMELDGKAVPISTLGREIELDPGSHRVILRAGKRASERSVHLREGERAVRLLFVTAQPHEPDRARLSALPRDRDLALGRASGKKGLGSSLVPILIGSAALVVGATAGVVALVKTENLKVRCDGNQCHPEDEPARDEVYKWASASTIAFGVAGAGLTVGAVLYFTDSDKSSGSRGVSFRVAGNLP
jgi:hypothetical protein